MMFVGFILLVVIQCILAAPNPDDKKCLQNKCDFKNLKRKPNILYIIADDFGYGDLSSYGHPETEWNSIDDLAKDGIRFTSAYSGDSLCTPSRVSMITGRLPVRVGVVEKSGIHRVFRPQDTNGLPLEEFVVPEMLKTAGYTTGMIGKWHLGINHKTSTDGKWLPKNHGFDYVGANLPTSNSLACDESGAFMPDGPSTDWCYMYNNDVNVKQPLNHSILSDTFLQNFKDFINAKKAGQPFYFYFAFPQVHVALYSWMTGWADTSRRGLMGGEISEMAWVVGELRKFLEGKKLWKDTLTIFISDHGPHVELCTYGGTNGVFSGGKGTMYEGGFRIPLIIHWPNVVKGGQVSASTVSGLDMWMTLAKLTGGKIPKGLVSDGFDMRQVMFDGSYYSNDRPIYFYCSFILMGIRYKQYKFHFKVTDAPDWLNIADRCPNGIPIEDYYYISCNPKTVKDQNPPIVFDIQRDPSEHFPLNPDEVPASVTKAVDDLKKKQTASLKDRRAPLLGFLSDKVVPCCNPPSCNCGYWGEKS